MKFTLKKALKFGWEGVKGWAYNSKDDYPKQALHTLKLLEVMEKSKQQNPIEFI